MLESKIALGFSHFTTIMTLKRGINWIGASREGARREAARFSNILAVNSVGKKLFRKK